MIIGACGFGSTGSSAVSDYLLEYGAIKVIDKIEFTWVYEVDGLIDLKYHLMNPHGRTSDSIYAIERFRNMCKRNRSKLEQVGVPRDKFMQMVDDFIAEIIDVTWKWYGLKSQNTAYMFMFRILNRLKIIRKWEMKNGCHWEKFPYRPVYLSVKPTNFDNAAKKLVTEILKFMGIDGTCPVVFDQPFSGNNPQAAMQFFDNPYAIIVDRDPRDNYAFAKTKLLTKHCSHLMPVNDVKDFVNYYRALRNKQPYKDKDERVLRLQFEELVYHYDETTEKIKKFLSLGENPNPKSIFDPSISMPNTQVWKRYPHLAKDIEYIEKELPEYLFNYTGCPEPDFNAPMFVGKSPKNKNK